VIRFLARILPCRVSYNKDIVCVLTLISPRPVNDVIDMVNELMFIYIYLFIQNLVTAFRFLRIRI
jgi:hypothetical protein